MSATDSDEDRNSGRLHVGISGRVPSEWVADLHWNQWPAWLGIRKQQREAAQKLFPGRKVFAAHQCPDMGAVLYQVKGQPYNAFFIAMYGGTTLEEARQVLAQVRGKFSRPSVKEMQAVYTRLEE